MLYAIYYWVAHSILLEGGSISILVIGPVKFTGWAGKRIRPIEKEPQSRLPSYYLMIIFVERLRLLPVCRK